MHFDFSVKFLMSLMLAPVSVYGSLPDSVSSHTNIPEVVVTGEKHAPVPTTNTSQTINLKKSGSSSAFLKALREVRTDDRRLRLENMGIDIERAIYSPRLFLNCEEKEG